MRSRLLPGPQPLLAHGLGPALARHLGRVRGPRESFFCGEASCERKIFCERLPDVAARSRKTGRLEEALLAIVFELGGRAGARLAEQLGLMVGRDALLRRAKGAPLPDGGKVRVLGVDDFAFRKGHTYGTVLVDLERHRIVDLLPERSQETLVAWLSRHPEIEFAARDRSNTYREALAKGAPDARQVADRWHLLHNLALTLEEFLLQKQTVLRAAASPVVAPEEKGDAFGSGPIMPNRPRTHEQKVEEAAKKRHDRLVEQWKDIRRLYLAGADLRDICKRLGISPRTVYRYKDLAEPPPRPAYKRRASVLDPYVPYLLRRWNEGCRNGKRLYREIREQGYANSEETCTHFVAHLRRAQANGKPPSSVPRARRGSVAGLSPSAKNVAALFMRREEKLSEEQKEYLGRLCGADEALADARRLTRAFAQMTRNLEGGEKLDGWLGEAEASKTPAMRRFAAGLKKDLDAVRAGLTEEWSNGPVEGFVHKLKLLKRQGYGRAGFDLLRARMLAA
jgi:transposase